jgi:hypothetical protein
MINLAGVETEKANAQVGLELAEADIKTQVAIKPAQREVLATMVGFLLTEEGFFSFQRSWYYWVVKATKPFPLRGALVFNARWGAEARLNGYSGGQDNEALERNHLDGDFDALTSWHIDTQEALCAFVGFVKATYKTTEFPASFVRTFSRCERLIDGEFSEEVEAQSK